MDFCETKVFAQLSRTLIAAALLALLLAWSPGCTRSYYTGEWNSAALVGSWEVIGQNARPQKVEGKEVADLTLHANGTFEASHFPRTNWRDEVEFVNEAGQWKLIDELHNGLRSRWTLSLQLSKHHEQVKWDVFVGENEQPYVGLVYDLDSNAAVLFAKAAK